MEQRQVFLRDILTVIFKRLFFIIGFVLLVFVLVFVGNYLWPPTYESMAKVQITKGRETVAADPSVLDAPTGAPASQLRIEDVNTTIDLVYSNDVLRKVVEETGLHQGMTGGFGQMVMRALRDLQYMLRFRSKPDPIQEAADELRKAILVDPVKDSYVLQIRAQMRDPQLAFEVMNSLLRNFQERHREVYSTEEVGGLFQERVEAKRQALENAQEGLRKFREDNKVAALNIEQELLTEELKKANRLLMQLRESETLAEEIDPEATQLDDSITEALARKTESTVITEIQLRLFDKVVDRNQMVKSLGPRHPRVIGIKEEIAELLEDLRDAIVRERENTRETIEGVEGQMQKVNKLVAQDENLEREARLAAESYEYYRGKLEEAEVYELMGEAAISSIRITSEPTLPDNPVSPKKMLNLVLALVGGLIGALALAFFFDYLDHGLKTPEDVEHYVGVPALASYWSGGDHDAESRRLAAAVASTQHNGEELRVLGVASTSGNEDAEVVAIGLAAALAEDSEERVLYIDFLDEGGRGLLNVMRGECGLDDAANKQGALTVIGRGSGNGKAGAWKSGRMKTVLEGLREEFGYIVGQVPPVLRSYDALNIAQQLDGVILVAKADSTRREVVQRAMNSLGDAKEKVIGAVLTERKQAIPRWVYRRI